MRAVASVQAQQSAPSEIILVVDHNPELLARLVEALPGVRVVPNTCERGSSGARNTGVALATGEIVAFLDDDAAAQPGWLAALTAHYADPDVMGVGGRTTPDWATKRPRWWPAEFDWVIGCAYTGREPGVVRNLHGGNDSFRRDVFETADSRRKSRGRHMTDGRSPVRRQNSASALARSGLDGCSCTTTARSSSIEYPRHGRRFSYFTSRCYSEGLSKALVTTSVGLHDGLKTEGRYTAVTLPAGVLRGLGRAARGDLAALLPAAAIIAGLMCTAAGYLVGSFRQISHRRSGGADEYRTG